MISHEASELQRQTALSDAPRADQCDQTCTRLGEPLLQHLEILVAAEKTRERQRQYRGGQLLERGDGSRRSCTAQKGIARRARPDPAPLRARAPSRRVAVAARPAPAR